MRWNLFGLAEDVSATYATQLLISAWGLRLDKYCEVAAA